METHVLLETMSEDELIALLRECDIGDIIISKKKGKFLVAPSKYDVKHTPCENCIFYDMAESECRMRQACMGHKRRDHKSVNFPRQFKA